MQFNNTAGFGRQKFTCKVSRSGDLLYGMYVAVNLPRIVYPLDPAHPGPPAQFLYYNPAGGSYAFWVNAIGHALLLETVINIGAHDFDDHYSEFLEMFESLTAPSDRLLSQMTGRYASEAACAEASLLDQTLYIPMRFWFNRFSEQALPLVALYWHDVELTFSTRNVNQLYQARGLAAVPANIQIGGTSATKVVIPDAVSDMHMLNNLVYLDRPERAAFANSKSEYVMDQTQFLGAESVNAASSTINHSIRFNHPVQEIIWGVRTDASTADNDWFNFWGNLTTAGALPVQLLTDPFRAAGIALNNHTRVDDRPAMYFRQVQPYQSHSRIPAADRCVFCYCFGLRPEEMLHTGSVNMSRMDSAQLRITYNGAGGVDALRPPVTGTLFVFARNKNVMKITVGMAGLKFAA